MACWSRSLHQFRRGRRPRSMPSHVTPDAHLHQVFVQRRRGDRVEVDRCRRSLAGGRGQRGPGADLCPWPALRRAVRETPGFASSISRSTAFRSSCRPAGAVEAESGDPLHPLALLASADLADRAEFHWRLGVPLTLLVLTVLAVPLAKTEPRKGRFAGLASAVLVYLIYANLLAAGRGWLERGQVPEVWASGGCTALFLAAAGLMLLAQLGLLAALAPRFRWPGRSQHENSARLPVPYDRRHHRARAGGAAEPRRLHQVCRPAR